MAVEPSSLKKTRLREPQGNKSVSAFASRVAYDDAPGEVIDPETGEVMQPLN